jgi:hypothetical protein
VITNVDVNVDVDGDQVIGLGEVGSGPLVVKHCLDAEWPMLSGWVNYNQRLRGRAGWRCCGGASLHLQSSLPVRSCMS